MPITTDSLDLKMLDGKFTFNPDGTQKEGRKKSRRKIIKIRKIRKIRKIKKTIKKTRRKSRRKSRKKSRKKSNKVGGSFFRRCLKKCKRKPDPDPYPEPPNPQYATRTNFSRPLTSGEAVTCGDCNIRFQDLKRYQFGRPSDWDGDGPPLCNYCIRNYLHMVDPMPEDKDLARDLDPATSYITRRHFNNFIDSIS